MNTEPNKALDPIRLAVPLAYLLLTSFCLVSWFEILGFRAAGLVTLVVRQIMKYRILVLLLSIATHGHGETLLQFFGDNYSTESDLILHASVTTEKGKPVAIIENKSDLKIPYTAPFRTFPSLVTEKFNGKEWEFVRSNLCGGVVDRYFIPPKSTQKMDFYKITEPGIYRYYFIFEIPDSQKVGIVRIAELVTK